MNNDFEEKNIEFVFQDNNDFVGENHVQKQYEKEHEKDYEAYGKQLGKNEFQMKSCEELKEVCVDAVLEDTVKLVKIKAKVSKLCPNRKVAVAVQLVDIRTKEIISQKGRVVETGCAPKCTNTIYENFIFALPGCLCSESSAVKVNIVANYILDYKYQECNHCNN